MSSRSKSGQSDFEFPDNFCILLVTDKDPTLSACKQFPASLFINMFCLQFFAMEGTFLHLTLLFSMTGEMQCCCQVEKLYLVIIPLMVAVPVFRIVFQMPLSLFKTSIPLKMFVEISGVLSWSLRGSAQSTEV